SGVKHIHPTFFTSRYCSRSITFAWVLGVLHSGVGDVAIHRLFMGISAETARRPQREAQESGIELTWLGLAYRSSHLSLLPTAAVNSCPGIVAARRKRSGRPYRARWSCTSTERNESDPDNNE